MDMNEQNGAAHENGEGALSPEKIKQLEATLTNFITNKKASGEISGEELLSLARARSRAGHGSHVQE
jgi:hypothetical protein